MEHRELRINSLSSVAARHSSLAGARENGAVISPLRQNCLSIANRAYAAATRDWKCRHE
jgi:hypothetical protein